MLFCNTGDPEMQKKIGELQWKTQSTVLRRSNGTVWIKISEEVIFPANKRGPNWIAKGFAENFNPFELVNVVDVISNQAAA